MNAKEFLISFKEWTSDKNVDLNSYIKPVISVIESTPIKELLLKMQKSQTHLAILLDEYGGTAGLVTVEDILEEIVGEIRDEFDKDEIPSIQKITDGHYIFDGKLLLKEINHLLEIKVSNENIDTIGGWILSKNPDAQIGTTLELEGYRLEVMEKHGYHIKSVKVQKID